MKKLNKEILYSILCTVFVGSLIISNVLAFKIFQFGPFSLTSAVIMFPIVYIINDVMAEIYGFEKSKRSILMGFIMNFVAVIAYTISINMKAPVWFTGSAAYALVLGNSFRVLLASFAGYLVGSLLNSKIMVDLKNESKHSLFFRCIGSTVVGEGVDSIIFISIAFAFTVPFKTLAIMIASQALFKIIYEIIVFPLTNIIIKNIKKLPEE